MAYPFFSLAKSKRTVPIDFRAGEIIIRVEPAPEHGNHLGRRRPDLGCIANR